MRKVIKNKRFLLIAGLAIGLVTLFSHSLRLEISSGKKQTSEQTSETQQKTIVVAPSDAITVNFFSLQVDVYLETSPVFQSVQKVLKVVPTFQKTTIAFFQTLFRFIISPNAP